MDERYEMEWMNKKYENVKIFHWILQPVHEICTYSLFLNEKDSGQLQVIKNILSIPS